MLQPQDSRSKSPGSSPERKKVTVPLGAKVMGHGANARIDRAGRNHIAAIREQLLNGTYEPKPVMEIPKPDGGMRKLGHPNRAGPFYPASGDAGSAEAMGRRFPDTAMGFDRVDPHITPWLKRSSISRKATDGSLISLDLEKFFDRVNHDKLMARSTRASRISG